jgi:hypothetical protein
MALTLTARLKGVQLIFSDENGYVIDNVLNLHTFWKALLVIS